MKKNLEWLKDEVLNQNLINKDGYIYAGDLTRLLDQLDEPEVLSQELPVIPKFVSEYLDYAKSDTTLMRVLELANTRNELEIWEKEYDWIEENHELFARAWLDGFTVEEEQKYVVKLPMSKNNDNQYAIVDYLGNIWTDALPSKYKMTEEEIRGLTKGDVLFEHFAVKVEEFEE